MELGACVAEFGLSSSLGILDLSPLCWYLRKSIDIVDVACRIHAVVALLSCHLSPCFIASSKFFFFLSYRASSFFVALNPQKYNAQYYPARFPRRFCMGTIGGSGLFTLMFASPQRRAAWDWATWHAQIRILSVSNIKLHEKCRSVFLFSHANNPHRYAALPLEPSPGEALHQNSGQWNWWLSRDSSHAFTAIS